MNAQIHISRFGRQYGPYSVDGVNSLISQRVLFPSDFAWYEGLDDWIPLSAMPGVVFGAQVQTNSHQQSFPVKAR